MGKIELRDLIPPIFYRAVNYFGKVINWKKDGAAKIHPFDAIPDNLDVKWILDVGANVGDVAVAALRSYPNAQIICFEPVKSTFEILTRRMDSYSSRSYLFNVALSDNEEAGIINITTSHGANSISPQAKFHQDFNPHVREVGKEEINLVRLDDFALNFPSKKIDVMKIDVEGHELKVLEGGANFIANNVDVIIIEISLMRDQSLNDQALFKIFDFFSKTGFCLVNVMDLHHVKNQAMQLVQMDCVFRNTRKISNI